MRQHKRISFISTVYNEESTITDLLHSLFQQTQLPDEIVITDAGSTDQTVKCIKAFLKNNKYTGKFTLLVKKGNRSVGRNAAIEKATSEIIVCSDAGNILERNWIKYITKPFRDKTVDVVAGFYKATSKTVFQKCLAPYALVMQDKVNPKNFLPSTRSIAFKKIIWKKLGGFDEGLDYSEDLAFARKIKENGILIYFAKDAIVSWIPRKNLLEAFFMMYHFARGDIQANIIRPKVLLLFFRYIVGLFLILLYFYIKSKIILVFISTFVILYLIWSILKNYKYVSHIKALIFLPILQITADAAVIFGTSIGIVTVMRRSLSLANIKKHRVLLFIILCYVLLVFSTLSWGTPNKTHPFLYNMDEWHQLMAMKAIIKKGTTTVAGAAYSPFVYFYISGVYLIPFILLHIINPFVIKSPFSDLNTQQRLFEILRSVNIFLTIGSITFLIKMCIQYLKIHYIFVVYLFVLSPILLILSGYFKYDIALLFMIVLALFFGFRFGENPTLKNYILFSFTCGLAFATKYSAIPLLPILVVTYFIYKPLKIQNLYWIPIGILIFLLTFIVIGNPNLLLGYTDYREFLYSNLIGGLPQQTANFNFPYPWWIYLSFVIYPLEFGHAFYVLSVCSFLFIIIFILKQYQMKRTINKQYLFLLMAFLFFVMSLIPLKIGAWSNRALVLLPFFALLSGAAIETVTVNGKSTLVRKVLFSLVIVIVIIHGFEAIAWTFTKTMSDPQFASSVWIEQHIAKGSLIGLENVPIYQAEPNVIESDFYAQQYRMPFHYDYTYEIISDKTTKFPPIIILTNAEIDEKLSKQSPKKSLYEHVLHLRYHAIKTFTPNYSLFKYLGGPEEYYTGQIIGAPAMVTVFEK